MVISGTLTYQGKACDLFFGFWFLVPLTRRLFFGHMMTAMMSVTPFIIFSTHQPSRRWFPLSLSAGSTFCHLPFLPPCFASHRMTVVADGGGIWNKWLIRSNDPYRLYMRSAYVVCEERTQACANTALKRTAYD